MLIGKIQGDNGSDDDTDGRHRKANAFEELPYLQRDEDTDPIKEIGRGVFCMKFMQDAMALDVPRVAEAADDFRDAIARLGESGEDAGGGEDGATDAGNIRIQRVVGRLSLRPDQAAVKLRSRRTTG
ncbi:hypothetical protein JB92DRAFT_2840304 [Gautieria morchelliformis]|nr:hypothetical protein JB92DRAFT_2840304 [Gautieria morchelliformis]